jgi:ferrochelatase
MVGTLSQPPKSSSRGLGIRAVRAGTVGAHPRFVRMIRELIEERTTANHARCALGRQGPSHDICPIDCCPEK